MAIGANALTSGVSGTAASGFSTASISPSGNALLVIAIQLADGSDPGAISVSGFGLTWTQRLDSYYDQSGTDGRLYVYTAVTGASPGSDTIDVTFDENASVTHRAFSVFEFTGVDTTAPIAGTAIDENLTAFSALTVDLGTRAGGNATMYVLGYDSTTAPTTLDASFTTIHALSQNRRMYTGYDLGGDQVITHNLAASDVGTLIGMEIQEAAAGGTTVTPGVIATTSTLPTPTPQGAAAVSPAAIATSSAMPAPGAEGEALSTPGEVATLSTVPTPQPLIAKTVTPDVIATLVSLPTPTPLGPALVTVGVIATSSTLPTPTPVVGGTPATVTPDVVATVSTVPTPGAEGEAVTTPDEIATVSAVPTPTPQGAAAVSPAAIATSSAMPAPTPAGEAATAPAVIVTTVALPIATPSVDTSVAPATVVTVSAMSAPTPVGGTAVSPDVIATLVDILIPLASGDPIDLTAPARMQFHRVGGDLVLSEVGRGGRTGFRISEGFERVSEVFGVDTTEGAQGHRDAAMLAVASVWAVHFAAPAATLKTAIDTALQTAGFRAPGGGDLT